MSIPRLILNRPVTIRGYDYFGKGAWIRFSPYEKPGWHWKPNFGRPVPITPRNVVHHHRRITVVNPPSDRSLAIYEHIGSLRWTGLDHVLIEGSSFPPYHGRPHEIWEALKVEATPNGRCMQWVQGENGFRAFDNRKFPRFVEYTPLEPGEEPHLHATVTIDYKGLGTRTLEWKTPGPSLDPIWETPTQGWPRWTYKLSRFTRAIGLWRHHDRIFWPQTHGVDETLDAFCRHRMGDLLGTLNILGGERLLAGRVHSHCGGHELDLNLVRAMRVVEVQ